MDTSPKGNFQLFFPWNEIDIFFVNVTHYVSEFLLGKKTALAELVTFQNFCAPECSRRLSTTTFTQANNIIIDA